MPAEPATKYAVSFIDGQNLFHHAKAAFGHYHPNFDPIKLANAVCTQKGWHPTQVRFYTGIPDSSHDPRWHAYWSRRLTAMRRAGVHVTSRPLQYQRDTDTLPDGTEREVITPREKGVDLRIGLDVVRMARSNQFDVAVIFSQDQDLAELVEEVREISRSSDRWIKLASAFPDGSTATSHRGIDRTEWVRLDSTLYDACLDPRDYRPPNW